MTSEVRQQVQRHFGHAEGGGKVEGVDGNEDAHVVSRREGDEGEDAVGAAGLLKDGRPR